MHTLWQDIRFGVRMWRSSPAFTMAAVLCFTLGIGATTAIFSVVNAVLLRPLTYDHPDQLIRVYTEFPNFPNGGLHRFWTSPPEFLDLRRDANSWQSLEAWVVTATNIAGEAQPVRVTSAAITGGMLPMLGVKPVLGRAITAEDDKPGANPVAVISYGLWQSTFGGDRNVVGRDTLVNGRNTTIIGVMPRGFAFPPDLVDPVQVWTPLQIDPANPGGRGSHFLYLLGRLKLGVSPQQAQSELEALVESYGEKRAPNTHSFSNDKQGPHLLVSFPFQAEVVFGVKQALWMLLGAVVFVLLIACVNVANLLLARAEARRREIAVRSALGAGNWRLVRQFATEGVLLAGVGALLGLGLAFGAVKLLLWTNAGAIPRAQEITLDLNVLLFTLATAFAVGVLFGLAPILSLWSDLAASLKETASSTTGAAGAQAFRRALVAGELALALVLLVGCGLMLRAFWKLQAVNVGLNPARVITMSTALPRPSYQDPKQVDSLWQRLEERLAQIPGAESIALASGLSPVRPPSMNDTQIENFVMRQGGPIQNVDYYMIVSKDYFSTLGIRLMAGRLFDARDGAGAPETVIINQSMARTFWPGEDPLGKRIKPSGNKEWITVIGVVEDVKNAGIDKPAGTEIYLPFAQPSGSGRRGMSILVRAKGDSTSLVASVRRELSALDPTLPLANVRVMDEVVSRAQARPRFLTLLLTLFSAVALAIASVGIYGVISYSVARRTKEFGLRMVLGAQPKDVLHLVLRQGAALTAIGVVAGLITAFGLTHLLKGMLFEIKPTDPLTFASVTVLLGAIAMFACYVPARRATRVDPAKTLHSE